MFQLERSVRVEMNKSACPVPGGWFQSSWGWLDRNWVAPHRADIEYTANIAYSTSVKKYGTHSLDVALGGYAISEAIAQDNESSPPTYLEIESGTEFVVEGWVNFEWTTSNFVTSSQEIKIKFTEDTGQFKINQNINRNYVLHMQNAQEISDATIKGDAEATQKLQGDETKKISE